MSKLEEILEFYEDEEILIADGFDDAVIGICYQSQRLIYLYSKCLDVLINRDNMSIEEANEFMSFNVVSAYMGDNTPIWCMD